MIAFITQAIFFAPLLVRDYRWQYVHHVMWTAFAFDLYIALRALVALARNESCGPWKAYVILCIASPFWIWVLAELEIIIADLTHRKGILPTEELLLIIISGIVMGISTAVWLQLWHRHPKEK